MKANRITIVGVALAVLALPAPGAYAANAVLRYPGPLQRNLNTVCWTGTQFIAGGDAGVVLSSSDGSAWTVVTTPLPADSPRSPAWRSSAGGAGKAVLGGDGSHFLVTNNGINWSTGTVQPSPGVIPETFPLVAATFNGSAFTLAGPYDAAAFVSANGAVWTREPAPAFFRSLTTNGPETLGWSNSNLRDVLRKGGGSWEVITTNLDATMNDLAWIGVRYVGVGNSGVVATSPDGVLWTTRTSGTAANLTHVVWTGTHAVAVGAGGTIITSPDGVNWTPQASGVARDLNGIAWSGAKLVAVGKGGVITASPNSTGSSWTVTKPGSGPLTVTSIGWTGSSAIAIVREGNDYATLFSADGISWTRTAAPGPQPGFISCMAAGAGRVVVGDNTGLWSCPPDASSWHQIAPYMWIGVVWDGSRFVALTHSSSRVGDWDNSIHTSRDGFEFVSGPLVARSPFDGLGRMPPNDITFTGQRYILYGTQSPDAVTWQPAATPIFSRLFTTTRGVVAVGRSGNIWTSPDGVSWTSSVVSEVGYWNQVTWTGSRLLAALTDYKGGIYEGGPGRTWQKVHDDQYATGIAWTGTRARALVVSNGMIYSLENLEAELPVIWQSWQDSYFTPEQVQNETVTGALADPDGDAVPNVIEYMTVNDPTKANAAGVLTVVPPAPGQAARVQWQQDTGRTEVSVKAEVSADLAVWDETTITPVSGIAGGIRTMQAGAPATVGRYFFRLRAILLP